MRTLAQEKLFWTVVVTVSILVVGLFHPDLSQAQSDCPSGFEQGTDAWGVRGCINIGYRCPTGGSWSVRDNKCDCLPGTPNWDSQNKVCVTAAANPPPNEDPLANCPQSVTYCDAQHQNP